MFVAFNDVVVTTVGANAAGHVLRIRSPFKVGDELRAPTWEAGWFRTVEEREPFVTTTDQETILSWLRLVEVYARAWTPGNRGTLVKIVLEPARFFEFVGTVAVAEKQCRFRPTVPSGSSLN